jgi:hypothetical protein
MRRAAYTALTRLAILPWVAGMLSLALAYRLATLAHRIDPTATAPNCWVYAAQQWAIEYQAWAEAGFPAGREPYGVIRGSRLVPKWIPHALVGLRDPDSGLMDLSSFIPDSDEPLRWRDLLKAVDFPGRVKRGD